MKTEKGRKDRETLTKKNRRKVLDYLSDPENDFLTRCKLSTQVLGYAEESTIYRSLSPTILDEIEIEAFEIRKKRSSGQATRLFAVMYKNALDGDMVAAKEWLERTQGKVVNKNQNDTSITMDGLKLIAGKE